MNRASSSNWRDDALSSAARTLALYRESFERLQRFAADAKVTLRSAQTHHVRRWAAQLHGRGLWPPVSRR